MKGTCEDSGLIWREPGVSFCFVFGVCVCVCVCVRVRVCVCVWNG